MRDDAFYMRRALALAARGRVTVSPNPMVGCVIVRNGRVIAEGWHKVRGQAHAETMALARAGVKARGSVMYVTLEPCAHWGKTPPCVDAVIAAGICRIVIAMRDPNPLTDGSSVRKMKAAGIEVVVGVLADEARVLNAAFVKYITRQMPYVTVKTAQTIDGRTVTRRGESQWITSAEARDHAKEQRSEFDAVCVGINTVIADDPQLNAPGKTITKIVLDSRLRISAKARLFEGTQPGQVIVAATSSVPALKVRRLEERGAVVLRFPARKGRVPLTLLFKELARREIARILIEGGAMVIGSALKEGLVDEMNVYIAPRVIGDSQARSSVEGFDALTLDKTADFRLTDMKCIGQDVCLIFKGE
jgi:diaminohydroxyphosphoribosylaminopyrimidine deaminase/5-amino-6-(5-phosphoribosylamino)uracil reductase